MKDINISINEAKKDKLFYVVSNIIIVNAGTKKCLILKRSDREKVHPGKWAFPGGKLEHDDVVNLLEQNNIDPLDGFSNIMGELAKREAKEECGLDVDVKNSGIISNKVFIRPDNVPVFMVIMTTSYSGGEVKLEEGAFSDYVWVNLEEMKKYDCIEDLPNDAEEALKKYK